MIDLQSRKKNILGLPIHDLTMSEVLSIINETIRTNGKKIIYGYSGAIYPRLQKIPELADYYNKMDIIVSDGAGLPIIANLFGINLRERIGLPNLVFKVLEISNKNNFSVYLLGAEKGINDKACEKIKLANKNIAGCFGHHGYFNLQEEQDIISNINEKKPNILLIGMSSPLKEGFAIRHISELKVNVIIPCGGMIDVISGKVKRPPKLLSKLPVTWLIRYLQEPRRLYSTSAKLVFQMLFNVLPIMLFKHYILNKKNPSIIEFYNINNN